MKACSPLCCGKTVTHDISDGLVIPVGLYSDGVKVREESRPETLYVISFTILHLGPEECAKPWNKHIFTVRRKNQVNQHTLDDIWKLFLWELEALSLGEEPLVENFGRPSDQQEAGPPLLQHFGKSAKAFLMQVRVETGPGAARHWACGNGVSNVVFFTSGSSVVSQACSTCLQNTCQYQDLSYFSSGLENSCMVRVG